MLTQSVETARAIVERLIAAKSDSQRERYVAKAAANPDCLPLLVDSAWEIARTNPAASLRQADLVDAVAVRRGDTAAVALRAQAARVRVRGFQALGRPADVLQAIQEAVQLCQAAGDALLTATVQIGAVDALGRLNRIPEAFQLGNRLVSELRALNAVEEAARVLVNLGILHYRQDDYSAALDSYYQAADLFLERDDFVSLARTWLNMAIALTSLNRIADAILLYELARNVFQSRGLTVFVATTETNLGYLHAVSGRYAIALQLLDRARLAFLEIGDAEGGAQADTDSGDAYRALNLLPEALLCYERASVAFAELEADYDKARADLGRAAILIALRRDDEAFTLLTDATEIFRRQRNAVQRAHADLIHAHLLEIWERPAEADTMANRAARTFARAGLAGWAAEARWIPISRRLRETGSGVRQMRTLAQTAHRENRGWLECRAEGELGRYYAERGQPNAALPHFRAGIAALERARTRIAPEDLHTAFLQDKMTAYEEIVGVLLARGRRRDIAEALEYVERAKSRLLLERLLSAADIAMPRTPAASEAQKRLTELRAQLSVNYHRLQESTQAVTARRLGGVTPSDDDSLAALEKEYETTARHVEQESTTEGGFTLSTVVATTALQTALRGDETLIEFYLAGDSVSVFLLNRNEIRAFTNLAHRDAVTRAARRLRYHLQKMALLPEYTERYAHAMEAEARETLRTLYQLLFAPLTPYLSEGHSLILVPHGPLHGLPFHAFHDGRDFLLDRWEFVYAPSASIWHNGVRNQSKISPPSPLSGPPAAPTEKWNTAQNALLMGLPSPTLLRIADEITELSQLLPGSQSFLGDTATLENFYANAESSACIHLATHALFRSDNPLFSGLQFADGWLLARDLYGMRLQCDLATLSACRTGVGQVEAGDELFGLPRGFLAAGARSVAASLWPVEDAATTALMTRFYRHLAHCGKAAALRAAQREMREEYPHPYHWGAFVLMGER